MAISQPLAQISTPEVVREIRLCCLIVLSDYIVTFC